MCALCSFLHALEICLKTHCHIFDTAKKTTLIGFLENQHTCLQGSKAGSLNTEQELLRLDEKSPSGGISDQKSGWPSEREGKSTIANMNYGRQTNMVPKDLVHLILTKNKIMVVPSTGNQAMRNLYLRRLLARTQRLMFPTKTKSLTLVRETGRGHQCYYNPAACF